MSIFPWKDEFIKVVLIVLVILFLVIMALSAQPARAQGPFQTPTPLPAVVATQQAASDAVNAAQASRNQADALERQAAEIRRNADAQAQAAAQGLADARAAAASQNGAAFGEAIGRADSNLEQLRASVEGQARIIATQATDNASKADAITRLQSDLSDTRAKLQQAQSEKGVIQQNFEALQAYQEAHKNDSLVGNAAVLFVFVVVIGLFVTLAYRAISNRRAEPTITTTPSVMYEPTEDEVNHDDDQS